MLNILVCVKQVPDINLVKMDPVTGSLIRAGVPAILNPLDANALEAAVRVKEAHGGTVTVITMGPDMAKEALRECLAAGADRAVLLSDRAFANADTLATSYVIASAAKLLGAFDLIFCGKESLDGATGQMGSQLAERFGARSPRRRRSSRWTRPRTPSRPSATLSAARRCCARSIPACSRSRRRTSAPASRT